VTPVTDHTSPSEAEPGRGGALNLARQQRFWTRRAATWDHGAGNNPGLVKVVDQVIRSAKATPQMRAVDLGCGSGQLTLTLARQVESIVAVDISQTMIDLLTEHATSAGIGNLEGVASPIERLVFPDGSLDLVVTNYALHHLRDRDKAALIERAHGWLKPEGRLVIGDMMFGRGGDARDREIISSKLRLLVKKGPGGWWRILKNASRYFLRLQERPVSIDAWTEMCRVAGFASVESIPVVNEAAVVCATKASAT
jgi:ubiquinone/menaquinone biosynthesis C-methylase UbiE